MKTNEIIKVNENIFRILSLNDNKVLVIDCIKATMPIWVDTNSLVNGEKITEEELLITLNTTLLPYDNLSNIQKKTVQEKYNLIAPIINCIDYISERNEMIQRVYERKGLSKQTIRKYLCQFLIYQDICCFAKPKKEKELSEDEKHFRYILNKHFYNSQKKSLRTTYLYLLREFYTNSNGNLIDNYPKFHQLKYFYYKHRKMDNFYISRLGKAQYERDYKPLLGDTHSYFNSVGVGMADSTILDIWLVDSQNNLIGRSILYTLICPYSELCLGYTIGLEGGNTSLIELILNANSNYGLCNQIYCDRGKEFLSNNFGQLTDLSVEVINLKAFAPNLKYMVEKFFDIIQKYFKRHLQNKGVINKDFAIRGAPNYQKQATLTLEEFKHIMDIAIQFYNTKRIVENIPYQCVEEGVKPFSIDIFNYSYQKNPNTFIHISNEDLEKVLLPRTQGKFTRKGLIVNGIRYRALGYVNEFLEGGKALVAYNPYNVSFVFLIENGEFIKFDLIESFFEGKSFEEVEKIKKQKKEIIKQYSEESLESEMNMGAAIDDFVSHKQHHKVNTKNVRQHRQNEIKKERLKKGD